MKRRIATSIGVATLAGAVILGGFTSTATADARDGSRIQAAQVTVYKDVDFRGGWADFNGSDSNLTNNYWTNSSGSVNDNLSSIKNRSNRWVDLFEDSGYRGRTAGWRPQSVDARTSDNGLGDNVSSIKFR
ncbi:peptidase inhibitor family I36 protein [Streptomyces cyaneofuscatus]